MGTPEIKRLPCVRVDKRRGEEIRQALKERRLLRTDVKITTDDTFIYLPLIRELTDAETRESGSFEQTTREFAILESKKSIEDILGFKPSFEVVGDIAVLTESVDPSKEQEVAKALIDLHRNIKVVAKRVSAVEGVYRTREVEVIAGENRTETMHTEHGCRFKLDLEKVYFNPRLSGERNRVAAQVVQSGKAEEVIDMFTGVGPFAIQIAKRAPQSYVTAIDINPDAIRYLKENATLNGLQNIHAVEGDIKEIYGWYRNTADRIIMNLPKSAYLFLREALSMLKPEGGIIHFYTVESDTSHEALLDKAKEKFMVHVQELSEAFSFESVEIQDARKVKAYAPYAYIIGIDVAILRVGSSPSRLFFF